MVFPCLHKEGRVPADRKGCFPGHFSQGFVRVFLGLVVLENKKVTNGRPNEGVTTHYNGLTPGCNQLPGVETRIVQDCDTKNLPEPSFGCTHGVDVISTRVYGY